MMLVAGNCSGQLSGPLPCTVLLQTPTKQATQLAAAMGQCMSMNMQTDTEGLKLRTCDDGEAGAEPAAEPAADLAAMPAADAPAPADGTGEAAGACEYAGGCCGCCCGWAASGCCCCGGGCAEKGLLSGAGGGAAGLGRAAKGSMRACSAKQQDSSLFSPLSTLNNIRLQPFHTPGSYKQQSIVMR